MAAQKTKSSKSTPRPSWGLAIGLLSGCGITLLGVMLGQEPEIILSRALLGGTLLGVFSSAVASGVTLVLPRSEKD